MGVCISILISSWMKLKIDKYCIILYLQVGMKTLETLVNRGNEQKR